MHPSYAVGTGETAPPGRTGGHVGDARVLLLQDDPRTIVALRRALEEAEVQHVELIHVTHLSEMQRHLERDAIAVVVVDLGLESVTKLRRSAELDDGVAVIGIAPHGDESMRRRAEEAGVTHFVVEGDGLEELLPLVIISVVERLRLQSLLEDARRDARSSQAHLLEALMNLEQPALVVGPGRKVLFANRAATTLLGCSPFRLLATKFPTPLRKGDMQTVVLPDGTGAHHVFSARTLSLRWGRRPAKLVLVQTPTCSQEVPPRPQGGEHLATFAATGSEINARSTRVEAALEAALDHRAQMRALVKRAFAAIANSTRLFGSSSTPADAEIVVEDLLDSWYRALTGALEDTRRIQRLAAHIQRSAAGAGPVALTSADAVTRHVCDRVRERIGDTALSFSPGAGGTMVADTRRFEAFLDRLLRGIVRGLSDHGIAAATIELHTHASGDRLTLAIEARAPALSGRGGALLQWITSDPDTAEQDELSEAADLLRELGGTLRFGLRSDGTLWLQAALALAQPGGVAAGPRTEAMPRPSGLGHP